MANCASGREEDDGGTGSSGSIHVLPWEKLKTIVRGIQKEERETISNKEEKQTHHGAEGDRGGDRP